MSISIFYVFSQKEDRKHIEQNFYSVAGIMKGWDLGVLGGTKILRLKHGIGADLSFFMLYLCYKRTVS